MDDTLTRLAFRVQGGDVEAARLLLVEARERQHAAAFERAAKALSGSIAVLEILEDAIDPAERARVRALVAAPVEAAGIFTADAVDLKAIDELGPSALVTMARWTLEGLHFVPRYGTGLPYLGAALAGPWLHVLRTFRARVEAPWIAVRVVAALDPAKKALTDALVKGYFGAFRGRAASPVQTLLANEAPAVRRALWGKLLLDHPERVDDPSVCALLDDASTRELAMGELLRRGPSAARHAMPFLHASAPGTRRAVAGLLAVIGDASAIPILRQAIARERDARTRVQMTSALEKLCGAEPLVPRTTGEDVLVARARAALGAPRQPKPPAWLARAEMPRVLWRDGESVTRAEIDALAGRLAAARAPQVDAMMPDVRRALDPGGASALMAAIRSAFVASHERHVFPDWLLRAIAQLLPEHEVDLVCEEIDANLRTSARERWRRGPGGEVELVWDPEAIAGSPCRVAFAWLVYWAETGPKRRDREKAQRALAVSTRTVPAGERPFAVLRRFGVDDDGCRRFRAPLEDGSTSELVVRVRSGGAIEVIGGDGHAVLRLPADNLGKRVKEHVTQLEEALLDARRTLAEAYADKLVVDVRFVRGFLLAHPLWRPIAQGCVVRREAAPQTLRVGDESLSEIADAERVRFVLAQVEG